MDQNCLMCLEYRFPMPGILSIMTISQGKKKCFLELSYRIGPTLPKLGKIQVQTIWNVLLQFGTKLNSFSCYHYYWSFGYSQKYLIYYMYMYWIISYKILLFGVVTFHIGKEYFYIFFLLQKCNKKCQVSISKCSLPV